MKNAFAIVSSAVILCVGVAFEVLQLYQGTNLPSTDNRRGKGGGNDKCNSALLSSRLTAGVFVDSSTVWLGSLLVQGAESVPTLLPDREGWKRQESECVQACSSLTQQTLPSHEVSCVSWVRTP